MTLEYLIEKYIERTGYGMDMWSKEENAAMTTIAEIIEESKVNKISSNTLLADSCQHSWQYTHTNNVNDFYVCTKCRTTKVGNCR